MTTESTGLKPVRGCLVFLSTAAFIVYPVLVYFLLDRYGVGPLAVVLILLLALRLIIAFNDKPAVLWGGLAALALALLVLALSQSATLLMLYPTAVSLLFLGLFSWSLVNPPTMIERVSRRAGMPVPEEAVGYVRGVTWVWCGFFCFNAMVSAMLAWLGVTEYWAIYNGLVSYVLMGTLFGGEYIYRQIYKSRHGIDG
jgi:uncharacterized membrane protein